MDGVEINELISRYTYKEHFMNEIRSKFIMLKQDTRLESVSRERFTGSMKTFV